MRNPQEYDAREVRDALLTGDGLTDSGFIRYAYRPFDTRWLYWEPREKLVDRPRPEYKPHVFKGNLWLVLQNKARPDLSPPLVISHIGDLNQMNSGVYCAPAYLRDDGLGTGAAGAQRHPNLSLAAQRYLERLGADVEDLFHHALAVLHDTAYCDANADALRAEGPRIPLPGWPDGNEDGAADELAESAARGRELAALLDSDTPVPGVTEPLPGAPPGRALRPEIAAVAVPSTTDGGNMTGEDFALTEGWGHFGQGEAVMPGQGRVVERPYTASELAALDKAARTTGDTTSDPTNRAGSGNPPTTPKTPISTSHANTATGRTAAILGDTTFDPNQPSRYRQPANHACSRQPRRHRDRQNCGDTRRHHLRHLPQRPRLLEKRPRRRLDLQARRLPGPKEVALLPRAHHPRPPPQTRRSPPLHQHRPPHHSRPATGDTEAMRLDVKRRLRHFLQRPLSEITPKNKWERYRMTVLDSGINYHPLPHVGLFDQSDIPLHTPVSACLGGVLFHCGAIQYPEEMGFGLVVLLGGRCSGNRLDTLVDLLGSTP